jgi:hypothetical protein
MEGIANNRMDIGDNSYLLLVELHRQDLDGLGRHAPVFADRVSGSWRSRRGSKRWLKECSTKRVGESVQTSQDRNRVKNIFCRSKYSRTGPFLCSNKYL